MFKGILLVFLGGGLGSVCRYLISSGFKEVYPVGQVGTIIVNIVGCFLLGVFASWLTSHFSREYVLLASVGFCGGLTTYSTFIMDMVNGSQKSYFMMLLYLAISLCGGILAFIGGMEVGRLVAKP